MKMKMRAFAALACIVSLTASVASFDCAKAKSKTEKLICSDGAMSALDEALAVAYRSAYSRVGNKLGIKQSQRDWLSSYRLTSCDDVACLKKEFTERIEILNGVSASTDLASKWTGSFVRYWKGKEDQDTASMSILGLRSGRLFISGRALWYGPNAKNGQINDGEILGYSKPVGADGIAVFDADGCSAKLALHDNVIEVKEESGCGGLNVSFNGQYRRR
ncbi:hypothetical protein GTP46_00240 [Duganella sp. FT135W]|uniref:DUF1311 domain-containing protein n=1 Tax=Duganella flavida TaxID=2692175 RepID=A0A6L8K4K1_9BURK|nr:hypothetical protein [Duganella flavida]MYM21078.1 hypothetical protein [Duganella flavida]